MTASSAHLTIRGECLVGVDAMIRLTPGTFIRCCVYDDRAAILALDDGTVQMSITVPDSDHVTAEDLAAARVLAAASATYLSDLEHHAASSASQGEAA